ncbi:MAG: TonB-dependent receptor [Pseudomonadota bacterium]
MFSQGDAPGAHGVMIGKNSKHPASIIDSKAANTSSRRTPGRIPLTGLILLLLPVLSHSQTRAQAQDQAGVLEEIIVTARFRDEQAQDIGQSIRAFGAKELEQSGALKFGDLARRTAGLDFQNRGPNANEVSLRGVAKLVGGSDLDILPSQPLVSQFVDQIPVTASTSRQRDFSTFDLSRIEVLKGPQPTYFGEGSVGGSIRYFYTEPDLYNDQLRGRIQADAANIHDGGNSFALNGAVGYTFIPDTLGIRLTAFSRDDDGFIDNTVTGESDFNDFRTRGGRIAVAARPADRLYILATGQYAEDRHGGDWLADNDSDDLKFSLRPFDENWRDDFTLFSLKTELELNAFTLTSITGFFERDLEYSRYDFVQARNSLPVLFGIDGDVTTFNRTEDRNLTQEFRVVSNFDGNWGFVAGAFYKNNEITRTSISRSPQLGALNANGNALFGIDLPANDLLVGTGVGLTSEREQLALFAEATWHLSDKVRVIAGARWVDEDLSTPISDPELNDDPALAVCALTADFSPTPVFPSNPCTASLVIDNATLLSFLNLDGAQNSRNSVNGEWLPKLAAEFDLSDDQLIYASASKALRNGGTNSTFVVANAGEIPNDDVGFDADELWSYEVGLKNRLFNGNLVLNLAAYYNDWDNVQTLISTSAGNLFANAGSATSYGAEVETIWQASESLALTASVNYTNAEFDGTQIWETPESLTIAELLGRPPNIIRDGNQLPNVPEFSLAIAADYTRASGWREADFSIHADYQWIDERFQDSVNSSAALLPAYGLLNLRVGLQTYRWSLVGYVRNLTNEISSQAVLQVGAADNIDIISYVNQPRSMGLTLGIEF